MKRLLLLCAAALAACGGSDSTSPSSFAAIAGVYALTTVNGQKPPAAATLPVLGASTVNSGSGTIDEAGNVGVQILAYNNVTQATFTETGTTSGAGGIYTFNFSDGTSASASCAGKACTIVYGANTYVFTRP